MKHFVECVDITQEKSCWKEWVDISDDFIISPGYYCDYCLNSKGVEAIGGYPERKEFVYNVLDVVKSEYERFRDNILTLVETKPKQWRRGQAVFNFIDKLYGEVARKVQFEDGVDCFYDDDDIEAFIYSAYNRVKADEPNKMKTFTSTAQAIILMLCGIDTDTADMCWVGGTEIKAIPYKDYITICTLPCWSMAALYKLLPTYVDGFGRLANVRNGEEITEIRYGDCIYFADSNPLNATFDAVRWVTTTNTNN